MCGNEVHRCPGTAPLVVEDVGRGAQPWRERSRGRLAAPVVPHRIPELVVPLAPAGRKRADLIAAGAAVPRLGDELHGAQGRILAAGLEKAALVVEAVRLARKDGAEIEAEAVDVGLFHPVAQRIHHHLHHPRMAHVERVAGAGVVDVVARLIGQQAVVTGIVDALERQRRPFFVALGSVVVDHVQNHLQTGLVEASDHLLEFAQGLLGLVGVAGVRREKPDGVVAPVVGQAFSSRWLSLTKVWIGSSSTEVTPSALMCSITSGATNPP